MNTSPRRISPQIIFTFFFLHAFCCTVQGQTPVEFRKSRVDLHVTGDYIDANTLGTIVSGGLLGEFHYNDRVSALFPLAFGSGYFELGLGTMFAPLGLWSLHLSEDEEEQSLGEFIGMMLAIATSVESMGYHVRLGEGKEIIPFYSLCKLRSIHQEGYLSGSLGAMLRLHLSDRWHLNWSGEYSIYYTEQDVSGIEGGVSLAYVFR